MALDEKRLENAIIAILDKLQQERVNADDSKKDFAKGLAEAIVAEIKQAKINYTSGLVTPSGAVTGTIIYTIS